jgi:hypothetical protein
LSYWRFGIHGEREKKKKKKKKENDIKKEQQKSLEKQGGLLKVGD